MNYFYLTQNTNNREPECIFDVDYIHLKAKTDGSQTLILTEQKINNKDLTELTEEEAQAQLDEWVDEENQNPEKGLDGEDVLQRRIIIKKFL